MSLEVATIQSTTTTTTTTTTITTNNNSYSEFSSYDNITTTTTCTTDSILASSSLVLLLSLPDVILCHITGYTAGPFHRSYVICHQLAPLCTTSYIRFFPKHDEYYYPNTTSESNVNNKYNVNEETKSSSSIWEIILQEDYHITPTDSNNNRNNQQQIIRRKSKRLRQSILDQVRHAHVRIIEMTENAYFWVSTLVSCAGGYRTELFNNGNNTTYNNNNNNGNKLSYTSFKRILNQFGPRLLINKVQSNGGVFLVEICRAKNVQESVILKCIKELCCNYNADVNLRTNESVLSQQTAICVAAARGMPSVVKYLLYEQNAYARIRCSGRFHLSSSRHKIIKFINKDPYEFAKTMRDTEEQYNCPEAFLNKLNKCMYLLERYHIG